MGINIWERVLDFSEVAQQFGDDFVAFSHQVDQRVIFDILFGEFLLMQEAGVGVSENGVTVTRHHATRF